MTFARDIEPIFAKSCWNCHGADAQLAELDLSTREAAMRGGEHGAAIVPGNAEQSRLYRMVAGLESITHADGGREAEAGGNCGDQGVDRSGRRVGRVAAARRLRKPAGAPNSALAALENMELTPEQRNYWAFKLPVQKTPPVVAKAELVTSDRSVPRERHALRRRSWRRRAPTSARWSAAPIST